MNRNKYAIVLLMLSAAFFAGCTSSDDEEPSKPLVSASLTATLPDTAKVTTAKIGTRVIIADRAAGSTNMKVYWSPTDHINVVDQTQNTSGAFATTSDGSSTSSLFKGSLGGLTANDQLYAFYPSTLTTTSGSTAVTVDYSLQKGTLSDVQDRAAIYASARYDGTTTTQFNFNNATCILRVNIVFPEDVDVDTVTISANDLINKQNLDPAATTMWSKAVKGDIVTVLNNGSGAATTSKSLMVYIAIFPQTLAQGFTIYADTHNSTSGYRSYYFYHKSSTTLEASNNYNINATSKAWKTLPRPGDYYFSDGTYGLASEMATKAAAGVKPIGIIFSNRTSPADKQAGFKLGYALALNNAANNIAWKKTLDNDSDIYNKTFIAIKKTAVTDYSQAPFKKDLDGYSYCKGFIDKTNGSQLKNTASSVQLSANNYPAIYAAMNYGTATYGGVTNAAPTSTTTNPNSGWYLPSFGQWFLIFKNIGGFSDVTSSTKDLGNFYRYNGLGRATICTKLNNYINAAAAYNSSTSTIATTGSVWFWTSSEADKTYAGTMTFSPDEGNNMMKFDLYNKDSTNGALKVRSVIAF